MKGGLTTTSTHCEPSHHLGCHQADAVGWGSPCGLPTSFPEAAGLPRDPSAGRTHSPQAGPGVNTHTTLAEGVRLWPGGGSRVWVGQ